jgi:hypothetical protein
MIAQFFLTALLAAILLYAWLEYSRSPFVGSISVLAACAGLYFVWFPGHATRIAETVGIGRGVDLILYTWVGITFIVLLNLHLKVRAQMELITQLARELTIARADSTASELSPRPGLTSVAARE